MSASSSASEPQKPGFAARELAIDLIENVVYARQPLDALQPQIARADLSREDRAFAMTLTLHALRYHGALKALLAQKMERPLPDTARRAELILILGLVQILLLKTPAHAAVGLSVDLAKARMFTRPYANLVNAVLRALSREEGLTPDPQALLPQWLMRRWVQNYGKDITDQMAAAQLAEPPLDLSCKADEEHWAAKLQGVVMPGGSVRLNSHKGGVENMDGFTQGAWWVQDMSARLPLIALGNLKDKTALDMCAAPGGKTAMLVAAGAKVTALDRSKPRLEILKQNFERLSLEAEVICADAEEWNAPELYEIVLLDAPCSSTGTLRRHPDVAFVKSEQDIHKLAALQSRLLKKAATLVAPGGTLVYATCSLEVEEGELQIKRFLQDHPHFALKPIVPEAIGGLHAPLSPKGWLRARPDMLERQGGMDGFFSAHLQRTH